MMDKPVFLEGDKDLQRAIDKMVKDNVQELDQLLSKMAFSTQSSAIKLINTGGRAGKLYKRRSVSHIASASGEAPKTDTGQLVSNITVERNTISDYNIGSRKGAPHGFWLEFGTRNMSPRPWLRPSFNDTLIKFKGFLR